MEVVRKNFKETLPLVSASINKADFLVIDAEFTGLINGKDVSMFDNPEEYYTRVLNGCTDFLLIQYGLCAFYWDEEKNHYMNDAYNFYLFPRGRPGPEKMFLCQSSSLDFLSAQGFDFNKMIKEGISYMTEPVESRLREVLTERQKNYSKENKAVNIPEENKQQVEDVCKKVRQFIDKGKQDEMEVERCNSFIRLLLFQELKARFKDEVLVDTKILENKNRVLKVTRIKSDSDTKDHETLRKKKEWDELEDAVGFSKVARMISQSEKLVIGHNMLLDVIHTLNHFFQPLPTDYAAFKEFVHCMFPRLLDTKYMSSLPPFKDKVASNILRDLYATLAEPPFSLPKVECAAGRGYGEHVSREHEAGYDAYVTGRCFLAMHAHVARMRGEAARRASPADAALKPFLNKLFLARTAHQNSPYMNLSGPDPTPSRDHVFHLTFPEEWQRNDLNQLFSPFGPVTVQFLDDSSAIVALSRREQAADVLRVLTRNARVVLTPFKKYKGLSNSCSNKVSPHRSEPPDLNAYKAINTFESRTKQVSSNLTVVRNPQTQLPLEIIRTRANSTSAAQAPALPSLLARKRTSSGVFQVDEAEPAPKKTEVTRPQSEDSRKKPEVLSNGRRKTDIEQTNRVKEKKPIEKFDAESKSVCVTAFKESENWD